VEAADQELAQLQRRQSTLTECVSALSADSPIDRTLVLSAGAQRELANRLADYERLTAYVEKQNGVLTELRRRITSMDEMSPPQPDEDPGFLEKCEAGIAKLKPAEVYRQVFRKALLKAYSRHGEAYTRENYRHKLFLMLHFNSLYYRRPPNPDTFLHIDEAQDLSAAEYTLLREILGDGCVFNLYGDINQSLIPGRSILDWEDLQGIIGGDVCVLNEDYRNTLQITEYCNQAFHAEICPIGIRGEPVSEMNAGEAIRWLLDLRQENPEYRTAVIVHRESDALRERLSALLRDEDVSWFAVDDRRLSVLTVENAKGLEFEAVAVLCGGMEINELYIAYTRALDHLCVIPPDL